MCHRHSQADQSRAVSTGIIVRTGTTGRTHCIALQIDRGKSCLRLFLPHSRISRAIKRPPTIRAYLSVRSTDTPTTNRLWRDCAECSSVTISPRAFLGTRLISSLNRSSNASQLRGYDAYSAGSRRSCCGMTLALPYEGVTELKERNGCLLRSLMWVRTSADEKDGS